MARVTNPQGQAVSGVVPHTVVATVVDNVDPDGLGRVKVKYPTLPGAPTSFWIRQVTPNGGGGGGLYALPEVDDEVLVMFLQGNQDHGVILGQLWNGVTKPPEESAGGMPGSAAADTGGELSKDSFQDGSGDTANNDRRFWRSRSGHLIAMDDTEGKSTLQMWDSSRSLLLAFDTADGRIVLANTTADIHIRAKQDIYLEAGRDILYRAGQNLNGETGQETKMEAGTDFLTKSGTATKMEAGTNHEIKAGVDAKIEAAVNLDAKGTMVNVKASATAKVEGGATVVVRGGLVTIN